MPTTVHTTDHYDSQREPRASATSLHVPRAIHDAIRAHGEATYPAECCGILMGHADDASITIVEQVPAGNANHSSAHNRYDISPQDLMRAQREGRARSLDIVGFYHSHPDHPAFWSATDLAEAHWFGCAYVITSIDGTTGTPRAHETNSFLLTGAGETDKAFAQQPVLVD